MRSNSHCDWEDIACRCDGHASAEHHLLAVSVQHALVWVPGYGQGESDVYFFMGFPPYNKKKQAILEMTEQQIIVRLTLLETDFKIPPRRLMY